MPRSESLGPSDLMIVSALQALKLAAQRSGNRPLGACLRKVQIALRQRNLPTALKLMDRAWRTLPGAAVLAPLYGRLLSLDDQDPGAALRVLTRVETPDADVAALTVRAYFRLRRADDARRTLDSALRAYALTPGGQLAQEASAALQSLALAAPGWIGVGPTLDFLGELAPGL